MNVKIREEEKILLDHCCHLSLNSRRQRETYLLNTLLHCLFPFLFYFLWCINPNENISYVRWFEKLCISFLLKKPSKFSHNSTQTSKNIPSQDLILTMRIIWWGLCFNNCVFYTYNNCQCNSPVYFWWANMEHMFKCMTLWYGAVSFHIFP